MDEVDELRVTREPADLAPIFVSQSYRRSEITIRLFRRNNDYYSVLYGTVYICGQRIYNRFVRITIRWRTRARVSPHAT